MAVRVAINGYGRIGRNILRARFENQKHDIEIVAINDPSAGNEIIKHLTQYDTTHGRFNANVAIEERYLVINGERILICNERDPKQLPWNELNIDVVLECSGHFTSKEKAYAHIEAGAKKVIISAPAAEVDATIVYGVNHTTLKTTDTVISNASCTTNCLAPLIKPLNDAIGIENGLMVTVHAYTNDQVLIDNAHSDLYRARAAAQSIIPTKTGAAAAVGLVLPELKGKLDGYALRVPTLNVSVIDLTFLPKRQTSVKEIDEILRAAAQGPLKGILAISDEPLVSIDFNHNSASSIYDASQTRQMGQLFKVLSWYDNEWGFSNRMLDVAKMWLTL